MIESPTVAAWIEQGRAEGFAQGLAEARAKTDAQWQSEEVARHVRSAVSRVLTSRFGPLPEALQQQLDAATEEQLLATIDQPSTITRLDEFRI